VLCLNILYISWGQNGGNNILKLIFALFLGIKKPLKSSKIGLERLAAEEGFEPSQTESESIGWKI